MACSRASAVDPVSLEWRESERERRGEFFFFREPSSLSSFLLLDAVISSPTLPLFCRSNSAHLLQARAPSLPCRRAPWPARTGGGGRAWKKRKENETKEEKEESEWFLLSFLFHLDKTSSTTETRLLLLSLSSPSFGPSLFLLLHASRSSIVSMSASSRSVSLGASFSPQDLTEAAAAAKTCGVDQVMPWK